MRHILAVWTLHKACETSSSLRLRNPDVTSIPDNQQITVSPRNFLLQQLMKVQSLPELQFHLFTAIVSRCFVARLVPRACNEQISSGKSSMLSLSTYVIAV